MDYRQEAQKWGAKAYEILMAEELKRQEEIKREKELEEQQILPVIESANQGDVDAILKLKDFAKDGNEKAKNALEKLYWDGKKEHAVGTVVIRDGITIIEKESFKGCKKLEKVVLPDGLTKIGYGAFSGCTSLKEIKLPDSLTSIGSGAFRNCTALKEIHLPDSLTKIGAFAFSGCTALKKISIPDNDKVFIGLSHFEDCPDNAKIISSKFWDSVDVKTLADFRKLEKIVLPEGLTSIGWMAFFGCKALKKIVLPEGLTSIGWGAFAGCMALTEIKFPSTLIFIDHKAFEYCSVRHVTYHKKIESGLRNCFNAYNWHNMEKIILDD